MATYAAQVDTYRNTTPQKRVVTDRIILASPYDVTTILALGLNNNEKFRFVNPPGKTYEWLEDAYPATSDTMASTNITNSTTTTTITVTNGALFQPGDVVQIDDEYVWVSAISSNVLTIVRGFGSTTQATHASTSTAYIRYSARLEGDDSDNSPNTEVSSGYNYTTILHKEVEVTRTAQKIGNYGINDMFDYEIDKKMDVLMERLDRIPYYGKRAVGSTTAARSTGGFTTFISTNTTAAASTALTRKMIDDALEDCFNAGGKPDIIFTSTWGKRKINSFYEGFVETVRSETIGGMVINQLQHPITGGLLDVVVDRHCPSDHMFFIDRSKAGFITFDPFFFEHLAKDGDYEKGQVVGEYGFVLAAEKFHAYISGFSTSA